MKWLDGREFMSPDARRSIMTPSADNCYLPYWTEEADLIVPMMTAADKTKPLLSLGCGFFREETFLRAAGWTEIFGIDIDETILQEYRRLNSQARVCAGEAGRLPYPDGSFACVCALFNVIGNFPDIGQVLAEAHRTLIDGGTLTLSMWGSTEEARSARLACYLRIPDRRVVCRRPADGFGPIWDVFGGEDRLWTTRELHLPALGDALIANRFAKVERRSGQLVDVVFATK